MQGLRILQYNAGKSAGRQQTLLANPKAQNFDIIALQEPSYNPQTGGTHCSRGSCFWPVYEARGRRSRVALLFNKRLGIRDWEADQVDDCIQVAQIQTSQGPVQLINVYVEAEGGRVTLGSGSALRKVPELFTEGSECILLGDFNLHHPSWGGERVRRADEAARELIDMTAQRGLCLATSQGATTWRGGRSQGTTIDLTFLTPRLYNHLVRCTPIDTAEEVEDHSAIETIIGNTLNVKAPVREHWSWRDMDIGQVKEDAQSLYVPRYITSQDSLEDYAQYVLDFTTSLSRQHGRLQRLSPKSRSWWSPEVAKAISDYRLALRRQQDPGRLLAARHQRNSTIRRAKAASFRGFIHHIAGEPQALWKMARWGRTASYTPPEPPAVPSLKPSDLGDQPLLGSQARPLASSFQEKVDLLRAQFFPEPDSADLSDIPPDPPEDSGGARWEITQEEVAKVIQSLPNRKAPGATGVPNSFLKAMGPRLAAALTLVTQTCLDWEYYPQAFKTARTVALRKPGKGDYQAPKAWRPIALLETLGKVVEAVIAARIRDFAESKGLLPEAQMGARRGRSTETAVALLLGQVRAAWDSGGAVASVLALDASGAFDRVLKERLTWALRQKGLPRAVCNWVFSFMSDRQTTLMFDEQESPASPVATGIPQGSPLSPILFLFYNAELLERCANPQGGVGCVGFVDDITLIAWGESTEDNCRRLTEAHIQCDWWARRYGARFAPEKYELMHFTRRRTRHNQAATIQIGSRVIEPTRAMRVLGVWLDPTLRWKSHLDAVAGRMKMQLRALTCLSASTWGLPLAQARMVYGMVIRPAMTYGALAWHQPRGHAPTRSLSGALAPFQNQCLRVMTGAYRAAPVSTLEAEAYVPPLNLYLDSMVARATQRLEDSGMTTKIEGACREVRRFLRAHGQNQRRYFTQYIHPQPLPRGWQLEWTQGGRTARVLQSRWENQWRSRRIPWGELYPRPPRRNNLRLYQGLTKACCSILTQIRTGKTGLAAFLHRRRVPGITSPYCPCGQGAETPKHILIHCERFQAARVALEESGRVDIRYLLCTEKGAKKLSHWWLSQGVLQQFSLAKALEMGIEGR